MRKPNGYGAVVKLSGKRRNPYAVRLTTGWTDKGKQIYKYLDYFPTRKEAEICLAEYNKNPYSIAKDITLEEVYQAWSKKAYANLSRKTLILYEDVWSRIEHLHDAKIAEIRLPALQSAFDGLTKGIGYPLKSILKRLFEYAAKNEYIPPDRPKIVDYIELQDYSRTVNHTTFTKKELQELWDKEEIIVLIMIYSGVRIGELLDLKTEDVHLDKRYFDITKSKTEAGIRQVPIAEKVLPLWKKLTDTKNTYVIKPPRAEHYQYPTFLRLWHRMTDHMPHDTRHTFISLMTEAEVDDRIIKQIVGHKGRGITEAIYTHVSLEKKIEAVNKI